MHSSFKHSLTKPEIRPCDNFGYSSQFVSNAESAHKEALCSIVDKKTDMLRSFATATETLRMQLDTLMQQADLTDQAHLQEINAQREVFDVKMHGLAREREITERSLNLRLKHVQSGADEARAINSRLKQEEGEERLKHDHELAGLNAKLRSLHQERDSLQIDTIEAGRQEVARLQQHHADLTYKHPESIRYMREAVSECMQGHRLTIEERQRQIKQVEQDLHNFKRQYQLQYESAEHGLQTVKSQLRETRQVVAAQEVELQRLQGQHDDAIEEGWLLKKEATLLTNEVIRVTQENKDLIEELKRMEKLVYGKGKANL